MSALDDRLRVVGWEHPEEKDFLLVSQLSVAGSLSTCRPDLVGFVNGLPWVVIELKKTGVPARATFDENLTHYKRQKAAARSSLKLAIEDALDTLPDSYDRPLYAQKCSALFEHVDDSDPEQNTGLSAGVA